MSYYKKDMVYFSLEYRFFQAHNFKFFHISVILKIYECKANKQHKMYSIILLPCLTLNQNNTAWYVWKKIQTQYRYYIA